MKASEICLFCNLQHLFSKYSVNILNSPVAGGADGASDEYRVIEPWHVRNALSQLNFDSIGGQDFVEGNMGCAQETLDRILGFLHREYVDPNYLDSYCSATSGETRWQIDHRLDEMGCTPKCASHLIFGIPTMDITRCDQCDLVDDVSEANSDFIVQFYVHEMLDVFGKLPADRQDLHEVIKTIIKGDSDFRIQHREEQKKCQLCEKPLRVEDKWLLELPQIFTIGFQYPDLDMALDRETITKLYNLLQPKLNLSRIYKISEVSNSPSNATYILRGLIVYYGKHYWAYFYSQKFDSWFKFDDDQINKVGNFEDVIDKCVLSKAIPRTIFLEKQDLIVNMLLDGEAVLSSAD